VPSICTDEPGLDNPDSPCTEGTFLVTAPNDQLPIHGLRLSTAGDEVTPSLGRDREQSLLTSIFG
jgi:hypothetical protein